MLVTINSVSRGKCVWCCQETDDAVDAVFSDGLKGYLCKKDFWAALRARATEQPQSAQPPKGPTKASAANSNQ